MKSIIGGRRKGLDQFPLMVIMIALAFMFAAVYFTAGSGWLNSIFDKLIGFQDNAALNTANP